MGIVVPLAFFDVRRRRALTCRLPDCTQDGRESERVQVTRALFIGLEVSFSDRSTSNTHKARGLGSGRWCDRVSIHCQETLIFVCGRWALLRVRECV